MTSKKRAKIYSDVATKWRLLLKQLADLEKLEEQTGEIPLQLPGATQELLGERDRFSAEHRAKSSNRLKAGHIIRKVRDTRKKKLG